MVFLQKKSFFYFSGIWSGPAQPDSDIFVVGKDQKPGLNDLSLKLIILARRVIHIVWNLFSNFSPFLFCFPFSPCFAFLWFVCNFSWSLCCSALPVFYVYFNYHYTQLVTTRYSFVVTIVSRFIIIMSVFYIYRYIISILLLWDIFNMLCVTFLCHKRLYAGTGAQRLQGTGKPVPCNAYIC